MYNKQFKWQDTLIRNVGLSFFKKDWVIKEIVYHPLRFAKRRMEDPLDDRPIRIRYFATFALKSIKTKERVTKYKEIYRNYEKYKKKLESYGYDVDTKEKFEKEMKFIGNSKIKLVDEIYEKSSVIKE